MRRKKRRETTLFFFSFGVTHRQPCVGVYVLGWRAEEVLVCVCAWGGLGSGCDSFKESEHVNQK